MKANFLLQFAAAALATAMVIKTTVDVYDTENVVGTIDQHDSIKVSDAHIMRVETSRNGQQPLSTLGEPEFHALWQGLGYVATQCRALMPVFNINTGNNNCVAVAGGYSSVMINNNDQFPPQLCFYSDNACVHPYAAAPRDTAGCYNLPDTGYSIKHSITGHC